MKHSVFHVAVVALLLVATQPAFSQSDTGFLSDYSKLEAATNNRLADSVYIAPGAMKKLAGFHAVMVDQPEVFIDPNSKYKGTKPDDVKQIADMVRASISDELDVGGYAVVDAPGQGVLYVRIGLTDVFIKKKKKGLLGYTPVGMVVTSTKRASSKDIAKKLSIVQMNTEIEFIDSTNNEVLGAAVFKRGQRKDKSKGQKREIVSWDDFQAYMEGVGKRVRCRLDNSKVAESAWADCGAIPVELAATN